ncbi:MAG: trypsin-like serine protease, partial [Candidatus Cloacimonetes bacterium]|nr:trypsin-like serine protease [Candidatus Cloacimonadota bacterium]
MKKNFDKTLTIFYFLFVFLVLNNNAISQTEPSNSLPDGAYGAINPEYRPSDSPLLRLPKDKRGWPPIIPPKPKKVGDVDDPAALEIYNVATGEVIHIPSNDISQLPMELGLNLIPEYQGLLSPGMVPRTVFPPDDRVRITPTTSYPWRTICKLFVTFPDGATGGCSGAIIDGFHVLTAGHCIYSHNHGGWATSIEFVPGLDEDYMPYNHAWATYLRSYTGWTQNQMHEHDWGVVTLDRNVGNYVGWMGRQTADWWSAIYTGIVNVAGYPADLCGGLCLYWDADNGRTATEHNHWYYMDTFGGQSGSPVWRYDGDSRYILTIHAYGDDGSSSNHGTRLNQDKFERIITWTESDTPPTDYADLIDDGQDWSGFSPTTVTAGVSNFNVWCDVRNIGTAASGGFYVSYYASTNTTINEYDYLIGTDYVYSISPFNWGDSEWSGTFPSSIPADTYYVGWIIDSGDDVQEFDENNNTAYKDSYQLTVTHPSPEADFLGNPTSGQVPLTVWFTDQSSGIIDSWSWSFLGGSPSSASGQGPHQVIYNNPDSYDVSLTISGPGGSDTETKYDYITVTAPQPIANFVGNPTNGQAPLTVWFTDQSSGIIDNWSWSFPGGNPSSASGQGPHQVIYNNPDSYDVSLIVSGPGGLDTETKYDYITVSNPDFPPPENLVAGDDFNGYVPLDWNPPSSRDPILEGYKIYRSLTSGSGFNQIYQIDNPSTTNYEDSDVINGTNYYYVVTAIYSNPTGESVYSNEANGTPQGRYLISGYVRDNDYIPIDYVLINLSGYADSTKYTDGDGYYCFSNLVGGKYYLITPSKGDWTFEPASITFDPLESDQNNQNFIGTSDVIFYDIAGYVSYCISGIPVNDVVLDISGDMTDSVVTNYSGYYCFSELIAEGDYLIVPDKEDDISANCISAMDAAWVLKYSIGLMDFTECQLAAGDVTGNDEVTTLDAARILKYSIGLIDQFQVGKDWCFLPESCYYQNLQQYFLNENYSGVVYGDVTHNWSPSLVMEDEDTEYNGIISLKNVTGNPGEVVNVPINLQYAEDVISARIMLTYNSTLVTFQEVSLTSLTEGFLMYS